MSIYASEVIAQPLVRFDSHGGGIQIASGVVVLDMRELEPINSNGWLYDDLLWVIDVDTLDWTKSITASLIVFPLTFDSFVDVPSKMLGLGVDSWAIDVPDDAPIGRTNRVDLKAKIVFKTQSVEILRVGYQLTLAA